MRIYDYENFSFLPAIHDPNAWRKYSVGPEARTRGSIIGEMGKIGTGRPGKSVKHIPIATLPVKKTDPLITSIPQDALHMRMRLADRLTKEAVAKSAKHTGDKLAKSFQNLARKTQVPFATYEAPVHGKIEVKHSSMTGKNWKRFLSKIGQEIRSSSGVFSDDDREKFAFLFEELHLILTFAGKCQRSDAAAVAMRTRKWIAVFVAMGMKVTPYAHLFHLHLPMSIELYGGIDRFSGELVEACNDDIKRTHLRRTDRKNPCLTLQTQLRIDLQARKAEIRRLTTPDTRKRKAGQQHPWQAFGVREYQQQQRQRENAERHQATLAQMGPLDALSVAELRDLIHAKTGKRTRKQNRENLIAMLMNLSEDDNDDDAVEDAGINIETDK